MQFLLHQKLRVQFRTDHLFFLGQKGVVLSAKFNFFQNLDRFPSIIGIFGKKYCVSGSGYFDQFPILNSPEISANDLGTTRGQLLKENISSGFPKTKIKMDPMPRMKRTKIWTILHAV